MTAGIILAYLLKAAIYLAAGTLCYKLFLSRVKMPSFNRFVILSIYVASVVAPAVSLNARHTEVPKQPAEVVTAAVPLPTAVAADDAVMPVIPATPNNSSIESASLPAEAGGTDKSEWLTETTTLAACSVAIAGAIAAILHFLIALFTIIRLRFKSQSIRAGYIRFVLLDNENIPPFSLGNLIFLPRRDYENRNSMIIEHEMGHIRHLHSLDMLLSRIVMIVMWWNPAAWLLQRELRAVHEYQADAQVLDSGHDMKSYQLLLIKKAAGARLPSVASSLNHSKLKQRFAMMYQKSPTRWTALRAAALVPAFCGVMLLTGTRTFASVIDSISEVTFSGDADNSQEQHHKINQTDGNGQTTPDSETVTDETEEYAVLDSVNRDIQNDNVVNGDDSAEPADENNVQETATPLPRPDKPADSVWNLPMLYERNINIELCNPATGGPTINSVAVTDAQITEYLTDSGDAELLESFREGNSRYGKSFTKTTTTTSSDGKQTVITIRNNADQPDIATTYTSGGDVAETDDSGDNISVSTSTSNGVTTTTYIINGKVVEGQLTPEQQKDVEKALKKLRKNDVKAARNATEAHRKAIEATRKGMEAQRKGLEAQRRSLEQQRIALEKQRKQLELQRQELERRAQEFKNRAAAGDNYVESTSIVINPSSTSGTDKASNTKLSARFMQLDNRNNATRGRMILTSPTTLVIKEAYFMNGGKAHTCKAKIDNVKLVDGQYCSTVTLTTKKLTVFNRNGKDYFILITNQGSVKVSL